MYRLIATHCQEEQIFAIPEGEARLGAAPDNELVLPVVGVSRRHALVRRCPGGVELVDLGSKNGLLVEGQRVDRAILTPGLRIQIGAAWLELQELSSAETEFALCLASQLRRRMANSRTTVTAEPRFDQSDSSPEAALRLVWLLDLVEANAPDERHGLIARFRVALGAEVLLSFERKRNGKIELLEIDGNQLSVEELVLLAKAGKAKAWPRNDIGVKTIGTFLILGRGRYFLAARFTEESLAQAGWRRDFLRFLAVRFFIPERIQRQAGLAEIRRVLAATGGNKSETARRLGIKRQTVYNALKASGPGPD